MSETKPVVGIIMGSTSDWPTMKEAATLLDTLGIAYEAKIVSAHRTPDRLWTYGKTAAQRGLKVIIAGAGGAAHPLLRQDRPGAQTRRTIWFYKPIRFRCVYCWFLFSLPHFGRPKQ